MQPGGMPSCVQKLAIVAGPRIPWAVEGWRSTAELFGCGDYLRYGLQWLRKQTSLGISAPQPLRASGRVVFFFFIGRPMYESMYGWMDG